MIDLRLFEKSLKLTWIRRFLNSNSKWKLIISTIYPKLDYFWKYGNNFSKTLCKTMTNHFWCNILSIFNNFYLKLDITCLEELGETSFLYNDKIKIGNSIIRNKTLEQNGIFLIKHLMEDNNFLTHDEFVNKFDININFLSYTSIIKAIKKGFDIDALESLDKTLKYQPSVNIIMKSKKGASEIYQHFISNSSMCKGKEKWISNLCITSEDWDNAFFKLKYSTKDTKLRWLQFRILHNILTTNRSVSKFKVEQTDLCSFCNSHSETIRHLFYECTVVKLFWKQLTNLIKERCTHANNFEVNEVFILLGHSEFMYSDYVCDIIILLAKLFIYRCKVQKSDLIFKNFLNDVYNRYCCEKVINKNSQLFINRWQPYLNIFKSLL